MVIGQKTIQKINNSVNYNNSSSLVIHINENWVVFCLFNNTSLIDLNKVNFLQVKKSTFILKTIKKYLKSFSNKNQTACTEFLCAISCLERFLFLSNSKNID